MKLVLAVLAMCLPVMGADKDKERFEKVKVKALAEKGDAIAQFNLGVMYDEGQGVEQSFKDAVKWYRKAADQGDADAQSNLGLMYYKGQGVEQDFKEAFKWWKKAADQGHAMDPWGNV